MLITYSIIHHQYCHCLIADRINERNHTQSSFLVDRKEINCIGIERRVQNCSYTTLKSHTIFNSMDLLALVDCRG